MPLQVTPPGELQLSGSRGSLGLLPKGKALLPLHQHHQQQEDEDDEDDRSDTSSIGACSSDDDNRSDDEDEEVQSKLSGHHLISLGHRQQHLEDDDDGGGKILSSLETLEDSLPFKRGLSNFYSGKSKSFTSLSTAAAVASAKDIVKPENPLNKRRRLFIARSRNRRASCSSLVSIAEADPDDSPFLPLLPPVLSEDEGDDEDDDDDDDDDDDAQESLEQASPSSSHSSDHHQHQHQQLMVRRSRTEKRRPSLFTVSITPLEARCDQDSFLTPKLVRSRSGSGSGGFARSLSLSDLSRHGHPHLPASTHAPP